MNSERLIFFFLGLAVMASFRLGKLAGLAAAGVAEEGRKTAPISLSSASSRSASAAQEPMVLVPQGFDIEEKTERSAEKREKMG